MTFVFLLTYLNDESDEKRVLPDWIGLAVTSALLAGGLTSACIIKKTRHHVRAFIVCGVIAFLIPLCLFFEDLLTHSSLFFLSTAFCFIAGMVSNSDIN